jgi:methylmalonyl-CoA mutase
MTLRGRFEAISERGGVLGAMDTMGMSSGGRGKIQEESMYYDALVRSCKKHDGSLPLVGVNTFLCTRLVGEHAGDIVTGIELIRSTEGEKGQQIENVAGFERNRNGYASDGLKPLQATARERRNVFASLMEAVKTQKQGSECTLNDACISWPADSCGACTATELRFDRGAETVRAQCVLAL